MVYWADWKGFEHGTDLTGKDVWTANLGTNTQTGCSPVTAGPTGAATAGLMGSTPVLYVPGGDDNLYALNALTGALMWKTNLGTQTSHFLWSSPVLYNGSIYEGISSFGDCPLVQGELFRLDAITGAIQNTAKMVPDGCVGAGIWSSPTIDSSDGSVYVTTGTPNGCSKPGALLAPSIVKLRTSDLTVLSSWTTPLSSQSAGDPDFGATPTLFSATINGVPRSLVGALNKDGVFYAWDRTNVAAGPVWQSTIAKASGSPLSIVSAAWDGSQLFVAGGPTTINGTNCGGSINALDPVTGAFIWRTCVNGFMTAGITEVPGVLIEGFSTGGELLFVNAANGAVMLDYRSANIVEGEATVSKGIVYVPLGNGNLIALGQ
jgi:polyvinyl alcohol dehydrogenase (cytochrome)